MLRLPKLTICRGNLSGQLIVDQASAVDAMLAEPTLVKRPVLETGEFLLIGFSEPAWRAAFDAR